MKSSSTILLISVVVFSMAITKGQAANWVRFSEMPGCFKVHYDSESISTTSHGTRAISTKQVYSDSCRGDEISDRADADLPIAGYESYRYTISLYEFNCMTRKRALISFTDYDESGNSLDSFTFTNLVWMPVSPGSMGDAFFKMLCIPRK
jgi:hypothetical protein